MNELKRERFFTADQRSRRTLRTVIGLIIFLATFGVFVGALVVFGLTENMPVTYALCVIFLASGGFTWALAMSTKSQDMFDIVEGNSLFQLRRYRDLISEAIAQLEADEPEAVEVDFRAVKK